MKKIDFSSGMLHSSNTSIELKKDSLLSIQDSATYLGKSISVRSVRHIINTRLLPVVHIGRRVYIRVSELDALIANGAQK